MINDYRYKSFAELAYIIKDAGEALVIAEQNGDQTAISKYADQVNDACTERYRRMQQKPRKQCRCHASTPIDTDYHHV